MEFKCSPSWITYFKKRHKITLQIISGEAATVDQKVVSDWLANEWVKVQKKTLNTIGKPCSGGKPSKDRLTLLLYASLFGEKRKPALVGKYKNPRCFKNKKISAVNYYSNKNAWMTSVIFEKKIEKWENELH